MKAKLKYNFILVSALIALLILILYFICKLRPTFDDWTYITTPDNGKDICRNILPFWSYWRPFDAILGLILSWCHSLFPYLNHIIIFIYHIGCTILIYKTGKKIGYNNIALIVCTTTYFIYPGVLGTVFSIDSTNQASSQFWGLAGLYIYLSSFRHRTFYWIICTIISILCKENGMVWILIPPVISYTFNGDRKNVIIKHIFIGIAISILYFIIRYNLPSESVDINKAYINWNITKKARELFKFIMLTWIPVDHISILHTPSRNIILSLVTTLLVIPFLYITYFAQRKHLFDIKYAILFICIFIASSPHLLTFFTTMHAYTCVTFVSLCFGYLVNYVQNKKTIIITYSMFVLSCFITDIHHWIKAYESGMDGYKMAKEAIEGTKKATDKVKLIVIKDNYPKYSSFAVIPVYSFGWGNAARNYTDYAWPKYIDSVDLDEEDITDKVISQAFEEGYRVIWIAYKNNIKVIEK